MYSSCNYTNVMKEYENSQEPKKNLIIYNIAVQSQTGTALVICMRVEGVDRHHSPKDVTAELF